MKSLIKILGIIIMISLVFSCKKDSRPNYQYFPNMYDSPSYETYREYDIFSGEQSAMLPAEGTIARGFTLFEYGSSNEEFLRAKAELMNPLDSSQVDLARGKQLYDIYCGICHGNKGDGQGNLVKREKILGVPSYADPVRNLTVGSTYYTIHYGLNSMGSYASQMNTEEMWQVSEYVMTLKQDLTK